MSNPRKRQSRRKSHDNRDMILMALSDGGRTLIEIRDHFTSIIY